MIFNGLIFFVFIFYTLLLCLTWILKFTIRFLLFLLFRMDNLIFRNQTTFFQKLFLSIISLNKTLRVLLIFFTDFLYNLILTFLFIIETFLYILKVLFFTFILDHFKIIFFHYFVNKSLHFFG